MLKYFVATLLLCSCVHVRANSLYTDFYNLAKNEYTELKQCKLPIPVSFDGLSNEDADKVRDGLRFWEVYAGRRLFIESYRAKVVFKNYNDIYYGDTGAVTSNFWNRNGCIIFSRVIFMHQLSTLAEWEQVFVIRHEIGHVLGLDDSDNRFNIMYRYVKMNVDRPSDSEVKALRRFYGTHE